jgi:hypothetical protein
MGLIRDYKVGDWTYQLEYGGRKKAEGVEAPAGAALRLLLLQYQLPPVIREWQFFHPHRLWALDYAFPYTGAGLAFEIDGGVYTNGRHTRGDGYSEDCLKMAAAIAAGWIVVRIPAQWLTKIGGILLTTQAALAVKSGVEAAERRSGTPVIDWGTAKYEGSFSPPELNESWFKEFKIETTKVRSR